MKKKFLTVQDIALIAVFTALLVICSWTSVGFGPVPFTLQTFAIFVLAGLLGIKRGLLSLMVYIMLGMVGVPVFSGFKSGPAVIVGPTGGYIIGFIFTIITIGVLTNFVKQKKHAAKIVMMALSMFLGAVLYMTVGTIWFMILMKASLSATLATCVIPFIIPDLVKIVVATIIVDRLKKYV